MEQESARILGILLLAVHDYKILIIAGVQAALAGNLAVGSVCQYPVGLKQLISGRIFVLQTEHRDLEEWLVKHNPGAADAVFELFPVLNASIQNSLQHQVPDHLCVLIEPVAQCLISAVRDQQFPLMHKRDYEAQNTGSDCTKPDHQVQHPPQLIAVKA